MMPDANQPVRDLVRKALLDSAGDWNTAERLCYQWLAENPALREQITQICVEWVIRNVITGEGRRQQQQEAERLREARQAAEDERDTQQTIDTLIESLRREQGGGPPALP